MKPLIVYGSLKKGFYNHVIIQKADFLGETMLEGFDLYSLGAYPAAVKGKNKLAVEVYLVDEEQFNYVDAMEQGAGYKPISIKVQLPTCVATGTMYVFEHHPHGECIPDGVWGNGTDYD